MSSTGYSGAMNYSAFTPIDNTGTAYSIFRSGYKNVRFAIQAQNKITITSATAYNMPGLAYSLYQDCSLWLALLAYNGLSDPLTDVYPGLTMNVPSKSDLVAYASRANQTQTGTSVTV